MSVLLSLIQCVTYAPRDHHHNGFMATAALAHIHAQLHVAGIQETKER